jgi:hypothetical protein
VQCTGGQRWWAAVLSTTTWAAEQSDSVVVHSACALPQLKQQQYTPRQVGAAVPQGMVWAWREQPAVAMAEGPVSKDVAGCVHCVVTSNAS